MNVFLKKIFLFCFVVFLTNHLVVYWFSYPNKIYENALIEKKQMKWNSIKEEKYEKIILGSSKAYNAYNPSVLDSFFVGKTYNMATGSQHISESFFILKEIPNLLYVNTNRIASGWNGDYPRERPQNMSLIHEYCDLFSKEIPNQIDLSLWKNDEIKLHTTDNIHFTEEGNNYIYNRILDYIDRKEDKVEEQITTKYIPSFFPSDEKPQSFNIPETITADKRKKILHSYGINQVPIASIVIGFRLKSDDPSRLNNLLCLLEWLNRYFPTLFEVILLEQAIYYLN